MTKLLPQAASSPTATRFLPGTPPPSPSSPWYATWTSPPPGQRDAVQAYLNEKVIRQNLGPLTQLPGLGEHGAAITTALARLNQPFTGANGFFAHQLRADMEAHGTDGAFTRLQTAYRDANAATIDILSSLKDDMVGLLPQLPNGKDMIATLKEALPTLGRDNMQGLARASPQTCPRLRRPPNGRMPCAAS
ncbi:MAG: hypothetical protein ACLRWP_02695 [Bilophila wadsworthia]